MLDLCFSCTTPWASSCNLYSIFLKYIFHNLAHFQSYDCLLGLTRLVICQVLYDKVTPSVVMCEGSSCLKRVRKVVPRPYSGME